MNILLSRTNTGLSALITVLTAFIATTPGRGQESPTRDGTTITGSVSSSSRNTLVVRTTAGGYQLFVFDRDTSKPASLPAGTRVRVLWEEGDEPGVRLAREVTILTGSAQGSASREAEPEVSPVVPREVRQVEREIERQARRFQLAVRGGVALDPELVVVGVQSQVGPFFTPDFYVRPNVEFGYGEVTAMFGLNMEGIYRLPFNSRTGRWSAYAGAGPAFNFIHQGFSDTTRERNIDFDDFRYDTALNILGGVRFRRGTFVELRTTVYSTPAPTLRLMFGYIF
jgi:hypothetical protein